VLAGAAEWLRETVGGPLSPVGRQLLERWLVPLRQVLGDDKIASAWAQGRALGDTQALVVALGSVDVVPSGAHANQVRHPPEDNVAVLSRRERQVATLVGGGLTNRQIAAELVVAERTVGAHIEHILAKLSVSSRTQIGVWASQHGLLGPSLV
jgi:DNA-binding NarL/FixJ family response regulator